MTRILADDADRSMPRNYPRNLPPHPRHPGSDNPSTVTSKRLRAMRFVVFLWRWFIAAERTKDMKRIFLAVFALVFISVSSLYGQNPHIGSSSADTAIWPAGGVTKQGLRFRPMSSWVGERFIFLTSTKKLRHYGYQLFDNGLDYASHVGRIIRVTSVEDGYIPIVHFKFEDNGDETSSKAFGGRSKGESIREIGSVADIDSARARWLGKTLWYSHRYLETHDTDAETFGKFKVKKYSPVTVMNIVAGWITEAPVEFIVQTADGKQGLVDIDLTGTNVSAQLRKYSHFEDYFYEQDPRIVHPWDKKTWDAIEKEKVIIGMTKEQAEMSWGKPKNINQTVTGGQTSEEWLYKRKELHFTDGLLTSFQK
jgi:hypothetical protein